MKGGRREGLRLRLRWRGRWESLLWKEREGRRGEGKRSDASMEERIRLLYEYESKFGLS